MTARLVRLARMTRRSHFPEVVAAIVVTTTALVGLAMLAVPGPFETSKTFAQALDFASIQAWGAALLSTGALLGGAVVWLRQAAMWPAIVLTCVWGLWSMFMIVSLPSGGIPSAAIIYGGITWLSAALAMVYWTDVTDALDTKPLPGVGPTSSGVSTRTYSGPERRVASDPVDPTKPQPSWDRRKRETESSFPLRPEAEHHVERPQNLFSTRTLSQGAGRAR